MSRQLVKFKVLCYSLILLVGGSFAIGAISLMDYGYPFAYLEYTDSYPFTLTVSSEAPQWNQTLDDVFVSRIGLTSLQTNATGINIMFLNSDSEVLMSFFNVTEISDVAISIAVSGESTIVIERVTADATVNLTAVLVLEVPPPPVAIINPWPGIFFWSFIALLGFLLLISVRIRHTTQTTSKW
ncbi:MAG: hypothetical protein ACW98J_03935, partial [Candidatus Thorarchaeota archaeon]